MKIMRMFETEFELAGQCIAPGGLFALQGSELLFGE